MKKKTFLAIAILTFALGATAKAQVGLNKVAQSTMDFLLVSVSPVASSMGEAYYAVGTGADAMFYNPAGMAEMNGKDINVSLNYTQWIADINYYAGAASWNLKNYGAVGISFLTVDYGTINGTSFDPNGGYIDNGPVANVGAYSLGLTYAKYINTEFLAGGSIRYVGQSLGQNTFYDGTGSNNRIAKLAFDLGVKYLTGFHDFRFSMAYRNFSSDARYVYQSQELPATFTLGTAINLLDFFDGNHGEGTAATLAVDYLHSNSYSERINMGIELSYLGIVALRGGYQTNRDIQSWSAGIGLNSSIDGNDIAINYSFSKMDIFSNVNRFSVVFSF